MSLAEQYDLRMYFEHELAACPFADTLMDSLYVWKKSKSSARTKSITTVVLSQFNRGAKRAQVSPRTYVHCIFKQHRAVESWMNTFTDHY